MSLGLTIESLGNFFVDYANTLVPISVTEEIELINAQFLRCEKRELVPTLSKKKLKLLGKEASKEFYNPNVLRLISCILFSLVKLDKVLGVRTWVFNSKLSSHDIIASLGDVKRDLKIEYGLKGNLTHEAFVGLNGTNLLRTQIPNFRYIYAGFSCAPPVILDEKLYSYCWKEEEDPHYNYLVSEKIKGGKTLFDMIKYASQQEFYDWFVQVIFSLYIAYKKLSFTHFSLDVHSVAFRQLKEIHKFEYDLERGHKYYITTNLVATIQNFDTSTIFYRGKLYYGFSAELVSQLGDRYTYPYYDAYSLLRSSYLRAQETFNHSVTELCVYFAGFFSESPRLFLNQIPYLPNVPTLADQTLDRFILYLLNDPVLRHLAPSHISLDDQGVTSCYNECFSEREIIQSLGFDTLSTPRSPGAFYLDWKTDPEQVKDVPIAPLVQKIEQEASSLDSLIKDRMSPEALLKATNKWRKLATEIVGMEIYAKRQQDYQLLNKLQKIKEEHEQNWARLKAQDDRLAEKVKDRALRKGPVKSSSFPKLKNLYDFLKVHD